MAKKTPKAKPKRKKKREREAIAGPKQCMIKCTITGDPIFYRGYGRPPQYTKEAKRKLRNERDTIKRHAKRDAARAAQQAAP